MSFIKYRHILVFGLSLSLMSCSSNNDNNPGVTETTDSNKPFLKVQKELDFGTIDRDKNSSKAFNIDFTNTGNSPLAIMKLDVSCGCIKATYTKVPIRKSEKGNIRIEINTRNQKGVFNKSVIIRSNAKNDYEIIRIKGKIE